MPLSPVERRLADSHRVAQARLGAVSTLQLLELWPLLKVDDLTASAPVWVSAVTLLVAEQKSQSEAVARAYIRSARLASLGQSPAASFPSTGLPVEALHTSLYVTGPVRIERARRRGLDVTAAANLARVESSRAASRHILNGGRETITQYARTDRRAGWARVTSGKACDFCSLLAGRGAVYSKSSVHFDAHDGCSCSGALAFR